MTRKERFEQIWSDFHAVPAESLVQYRWINQDGYRLPDMAAHYRTFCAALDSVEIKLPELNPEMFSCNVIFGHEKARSEAFKAIEAAGLKVKP